MNSRILITEYKIKVLFMVLLMLTAAALFGGTAVHAEEQQAADIITDCEVSASRGSGDYGSLWNNSYDKAFTVSGEGEQSLRVELNGSPAQGVYIRWSKDPKPWTLESVLSDGSTVRSEHGTFGIMQEYVTLPADTVSFRMITDDGQLRPMRIVELEVYSPGTLPGSVHKWEPTPATAELMLIATHQDDELLYFGGTIPYYAGQLGYDTVIAYTAFDNVLRLHEALDGLWVCGARQHPVFLDYPDKYSTTIAAARRTWSEREVTRSITELLVSYRPQVVVTQDINGEYGHGQHLLTVHCVRKALNNAENADYVAENFSDMQPWSVRKCYIHLYDKNRLTMEWGNIAIEKAGGVSSLELARRGYKCHLSQQKFGYEVGTTAESYDCRKFGLYWTTVGEDVNKNDFFENITLRYINTEPNVAIPEYLERTTRSGWHYYVRGEMWAGSRYLRYCSVNGTEGWYYADVSGSLLEPAEPIKLVIDDPGLDVAVYETLTVINEAPRVFRYDNGIVVSGLNVRYCAIGTGQPGFYVSDAAGKLYEPHWQVHVSASAMREITLPSLSLVNEGAGGPDLMRVAMIVTCSLLLLTALALSIAVARLNSAKKRRNRRRYR